MVKVALKIDASLPSLPSLPGLPPAEREASSCRIAVLNGTANQLLISLDPPAAVIR